MAISRDELPIDRICVGLFAVFGIAFLALAVPAALEPMTFWTGILLGDYAYPSHELHHLVLGMVFPVLLLGVIAQAYRPRRRVGPLYTAVCIWAALTVVFAIGGGFSPVQLVLLALLVGMVFTHPAGADQLPSLAALDRPVAVVAGLTALGALTFSAVELNAHFVANDSHVGFDHYLFMATAGVSTAGLAVVASFRPVGWRFPTYTVAFFLTVFGLGSVLYPGSEQGSSLGVFGLLVAVWALLFLAVAERDRIVAERDRITELRG